MEKMEKTERTEKMGGTESTENPARTEEMGKTSEKEIGKNALGTILAMGRITESLK